MFSYISMLLAKHAPNPLKYNGNQSSTRSALCLLHTMESRLLQLASLRSEMRSLTVALDAQRELRADHLRAQAAAARSMRHDAQELREDVRRLSRAIDTREVALRLIRRQQVDVESLAAAVSAAASHASEELREGGARARQGRGLLHELRPLTPRAGGGGAARELQLARERMRLRGVLPAPSEGGMFERLQQRREQQQQRLEALPPARPPPVGGPLDVSACVSEVRLAHALPDVCAICLCARKRGQLIFRLDKCGHCFHKTCLGRWIGEHSASCPLCRDHAGPPAHGEST